MDTSDEEGLGCVAFLAWSHMPLGHVLLVFFSEEVSLLVGSVAVRARLQWLSLMSPCCCWRAPPEGGCNAGKWGGVQ